MKIALAQINTATGDLEGNEKKIRHYLNKALFEKYDLVIFPELALVGYPPGDFLFQHGFSEKVDACIKKLAADYPTVNFIIGSIEHRSNVAYVVANGKIQTTCKKNLLPNYDVFDERRYFDSGSELEIVKIGDKKIGLSICEDIWANEISTYNNDPVQQFKNKNIDFIINISASPFEIGKFEKRKKVVSQHVKNLNTPMIYVNLVGGNDHLIFDGGSFVMGVDGEIQQQAPFFEEAMLCFELGTKTENCILPDTKEETLIKALTLGLKDFVRKCGFKDVVLGLSGGIDSALVWLLAVEALGKEHVHTVFMPSKYTSQISRDDVALMVGKVHTPITVIPIDDVVDAFEKNLQSSLEETLKDLTLENIQSRIRGNLLMAYSGQKNAMVINTGNKSEIATGYCTLYGDTIGGVSPLGDLYKHQVYELARLLNQKYNAIPERVFTRAPSAELRENQKDSDRLPEYDILDPIVENYIENNESPEEIMVRQFSQKNVESTIRMINQNEFKRRQSPPILKVSEKAFGSGRRMPIARKNYEI